MSTRSIFAIIQIPESGRNVFSITREARSNFNITLRETGPESIDLS